MAKQDLRYNYEDDAENLYEGMKLLREDFNCIDGNYFLLPTMEEMFGDDLLEERFSNMEDLESNNAKDAAFYAKGPFSTELGYHADKNAFVLKLSGLALQNYMFELNKIDGDTISFNASDVIDNGPFTIEGKTYSGFSDYCNKNNIGGTFKFRSAFINTPEIPHFEVQAIPKKANRVKTMTLGEAKKLKDKTDVAEVNYLKYKTNKTDSVSDRSDNEKISLYEKEENGRKYYYEIYKKSAPSGTVTTPNSEYNYYTIVNNDDSEKKSLLGGYKAQSLMKKYLQNGTSNNDIYLVLDAQTITANQTTGNGYRFDNIWYTSQAIGGLIDDWKKSINDIPFSKLDYSPYGLESYGRFLGTIYLKKHTDDSWINLSKLILADSTTNTEHNPDYSGSPELESLGGNISDALQGWTYDINNYKFVDLYADMQESYDKKIELHREITGLDFSKRSDCTVMIGDVLLAIPPTSIRNTSVVTYEKQNILRGKGSMNKEQNREQILELEMYFYNDVGINGVEYNTTLPNGEEVTYYMNGLRSLIAQFKVAPFLPIENGYINDVLCIEAVSLESFQTMNVEGFPGLVKVILTLRDFNYRVYMADLPVDDEGMYSYVPPGKNDGDVKKEEEEKKKKEEAKNENATKEESEDIDMSQIFVNMFAKVFDWELFRYYYQRAIMKGETASNLEYGSEAYLDMVYDNKNVLQRANVCNSYVSFYVPDQNWLEKALTVKKDRDQYKQSLTDVELDEPSLKYMQGFTDVYNILNGLNSLTGNSDVDQENTPHYVKKYYKAVKELMSDELKVLGSGTVKNVLASKDTYLHSTKKDKNKIISQLSNVFSPVINEIERSAIIAGTTVDEIVTGGAGKGYDIKYVLNCKLDESRLSREQAKNIYEAIRNNGGSDENSFKDGIIKVSFSMKTDRKGNIISGGSSDTGYGDTNSLSLDSTGGFDVIKNIKNNYDNNDGAEDGELEQSTNDQQNTTLKESYQDYRNPKAMEFIPYIEYAVATNFSVTLQNTFTKMYLKSVDGYAPQYTGAEDTVIELQFVTNDSVITSLLNNLPAVSVSTVKKFRRILSSWPLRIRNTMLQLMGINEVLVEQVEVSTVEDTPGLYEINMRLISVDRTVREREALKKVGQGQTTDNDEYQIRQYFDMDKILSKVDLYPDLDIPSLEELSEAGFEFSRYYLNNENARAYPDPDFYMIYAHMYTSALIKKVLSDSLYKNLSKDDVPDKSISQRAFEDIFGMKMITTVENLKDESSKTTKSQVKAKDANDKTKEVSGEVDKLLQGLQKGNEESQKPSGNVEERKHDVKMRNIITYMLCCDVQKGWSIKNGWIATKCEKYTNDAIREKVEGSANKGSKESSKDEEKEDVSKEDKTKINAYTAEIQNRREKLIKAIDAILDKSIEAPKTGWFEDEDKVHIDTGANGNTGPAGAASSNALSPYIDAVNRVFNSSEGKELLKLLCPLETDSKVNSFDFVRHGKKRFTVDRSDVFLRYVAGFLFASACAISGAEAYSEEKSVLKWYPRTYTTNKKGDKVAFAKVKNKINNEVYAKSNTSALNDGVCIGPFLIKNYTRDELIEIFKHNPIYTMFPGNDKDALEHGAMYKKNEGKIYRNGCMDRYYNHQGWKSKAGKAYRRNILSSETYSAEAFLRIVLMHLRKLVIEGVFISEIDIMAADFDNIKKDLLSNVDRNAQNQFIITSKTVRDKKANQDALQTEEGQQQQVEDKVAELFNQALEMAPNSFKKSFCARMIYPFISAITDADPAITEMILSEDNANLDAITANPLVGQSKNSVFDKFMAALAGINMFETKKKPSDSTTSLAQTIMSSLGKTIYISASNDPRQYVMHSYYDMLINDKRGRLVRAFPTYYLLFIDEGREIGLWRLFDNFYSMSAIADMSITKSRKNPTDVCTFSMNNMFDSYSDTYSDATTQTYMDTYGIKDVFTSIFSPSQYAAKEDSFRKRQILPDTTVMKPGVRTHVRIGYGGDASKLPIVFNGKIAEVVNGDVMDIVAQGDGHELTNPLNAFGELEAKSLIEAQQDITIAKDLRGSFARGGLHPRELMAEILTAKHGGFIKSKIREMSDGQFFNDNPFGIYHFGDHKFKAIFDAGEPVQNLYEIVDDPSIVDESLLQDNVFNKSTNELDAPTINTTIQDKTAWQILEMCANSGLDYIGAIRDFGLRSTVFLGRPNDYYAYAYKLVDDKILEKRKPFQQSHYYNSYTDIIYNSMTASEASMMTNAVGTWQQSDWLWGKEQATVGPIYLDMNIYPEYQKSMTVDTGLIAAGNGGIDINAIQHFLENTSTSSTKGDRVNKALAEMITTNCLKNSVKDMYTGELCIIGDPTVKPYDRVSIDDTYEDMSGMFEVETVIHNINSDTGFTTTIIPDVIVKQNGTRETERMSYDKNFIFAMTMCSTVRLASNFFLARSDSKIIRAIAKSTTLYGLTENTNKLFSRLARVSRLEKYITPDANGKVAWPGMKKITDRMKGTIVPLTTRAMRSSAQVEELSELLKKDKLTPHEISRLYSISSELDMDEYKAALEKIEGETKHPEGKKKIRELLDAIDKNGNAGMDINKLLPETLDVDELTDKLGKVLDMDGVDKKTRKRLKELNEKIKGFGSNPDKSKDLMKYVAEVFGDEDLGDLAKLDPSGFGKYLDDFGKGIMDVADASKFPDITKLTGLLDDLNLHKIADNLLANSSIFTALNPATFAFEVRKELIVFVVTSNIKSYFNSWLKSIQALCIFPMEKNSRQMIAGMNGHKGSVIGYPVDDAYNSIQGMVIQTIEKVDSNFIGSLALETVVDTESMHKILNQYKANLGISEEEKADNISTEEIIQNVQNDFAHECSTRAFHYNAVTSKYRVQSFDTKGGKSPEYVKYMIKEYKEAGETEQDVATKIGINENILELYPIEDDPEIKKAVNKNHGNIKKLTIVHSKSNKAIQIHFESGVRDIKYTQGPGSTVYDMPLLREDALFILKRIINNKELNGKNVVFKSGVRVNSSKTWQNTGFRFLLSSSSPDALLKAVKSEKAKTKFVNQLMFNYQDTGNGVSICVYPPKYSVAAKKKKEEEKSDK